MVERRKLSPQILFLHTGWAREYRGAPDDLPVGHFGYIKKGSRDMSEALNFKPFGGRCYGYAPRSAINVARLGAPRSAEEAGNVLVIWTATDPAQGGRYIVGWYRNATVHARMEERRPSPDRRGAIVEAAARDTHLVPHDQRGFRIPSMTKG